MKLQLCRTRTIWTKQGYKPYCAYCGEVIDDGAPDMHEVFLTRGDVRGSEELWEKIMVAQNCVLVHGQGCHNKSATDAGREIVVRHLLKHEGKKKIMEWLDGLSPFMLGTAVLEAKAILDYVVEEQRLNAQRSGSSTVK